MKKFIYLHMRLLFILLWTCTFLNTESIGQVNAIVTENLLPGSPSSEWDIVDAGDLSIQGFATDISYDVGEEAVFKIKTTAPAYTIKIYRLGYYQGNGARFISDATSIVSAAQVQPACFSDPATGLLDCGNWAESARWEIPEDAVSGIYIAKLSRTDDPTKSSHIVFIVRNDLSTSDLLFQTSDATWQAYNIYGDTESNRKSLYTGTEGKASKVSYNRPFYTRAGGGGGGASEDWLFNSEYPMLRFLEKHGYDVTYTTNIDTDRFGPLIKNHKVFMSVGHDEYWSKGMRDNVTDARDAGTHLAFFSGNEVYWKTRWENSSVQTTASHRTLVCYKEGALGENQCNGKCDDTSQEWTGLWRSGCGFLNGGACSPENSLTGQISWDGSTGTIEVPSTYKNLRFWRNTSVAGLGDGAVQILANNTLGYEWNPDQEAYRSSYPAGRITLSQTVVNGKTHYLSLYKHVNEANHSLVFGAGTVQWSWGLDDQHDRGDDPVSPAMQQATVNLFADMGVQPGSIQNDVTLAIGSTDETAPILIVAAPLAGFSVPAGSPFTIQGTASDNNTVAGIEISTDNGINWYLATGTNNWNYSWTPTSQGAAIIKIRVFDDIGNISAITTINGTVTDPVALPCPCTVFQPGDSQGSTFNPEQQSVNLGMRFSADVDGFVTGVRFFKHIENTGSHTGQLYRVDGTLLAQVIFSNETESGWQEATFPSPIAITANTPYIITYFSPTGKYSATNPYFTTAKINGHLRGLADSNDAHNGIYKYGPNPTFPTDTYQASNYFVDVVFNTDNQPDTSPPQVIATNPANNSTNVSINTGISISFNEVLDASTVSGNTIRLLQAGVPVAASVSYAAATLTATITPNIALNYATVYTLEVVGGVTDPRIKDVAGNALEATFTSTFTTKNASVILPSPNDGPGGPILVVSATSNPFSRYPVEILRAEGFNAFAAKDITEITTTPSLLNNYDVILLGEIPLSPDNVTAFTNFVNAGGTLIAFKPDQQLASLMGITPASGSLSDKYIKVNTSTIPGTGIVDETIQFHGTAALYTLNGAVSLAGLYSDANTATINPAVTLNQPGVNGGKAIAFTYDLARSIVYTRQGNPLWAGQKRDGMSDPIRSDDMFFPDWIDFNKVAIPQADEQQRLLANIILQSNMHKKPLPRFWYLPRGLKAAVVMTGDDHAGGGTVGRFDDHISKSTSNDQAAVDNWTAIRSTSYIFPGTQISIQQVTDYQNQGFEIALHVNTNCADYNAVSLQQFFTTQLTALATQLPNMDTPTTNRTHCIAWSDWATKPKVEYENGIRFDVNYYYWPQSWVNDRPGMFTGSGMPMRFADLNGSLIDVYQATTQLTDESGINYATHIATLLDNAIGTKGYYGVFTANMHTDVNGGNSTNGSDAIINAAKSRNIPVVSARQMLNWLDGRNNSSFEAMSWNGNVLNFNINAVAGSTNLRAMLPVKSEGADLQDITFNGSPLVLQTETIKGIAYAFFPASTGSYMATYSADVVAPQISNIIVTESTDGSVTITWTTSEAATSRVDYGTAADALTANKTGSPLVTSHSITLDGLSAGTTYHFRVSSADAALNSATDPAGPGSPISFTTRVPACFEDLTTTQFNLGNPGSNTIVDATGVQLKPTKEEFTTLPPTTEWASFPWTQGGTSTIVDGSIVVNGARYNTEPVGKTFGPGTTLEFVATFGAKAYQHIGFGAGNNSDMYNTAATWAMFSTNNVDNQLQARIANGGFNDYVIPGNYFGAAHRYKIIWNTNSINFFIDDIPVHTFTTTLTTPMRVGISDINLNAPALAVDWIQILPSSYPEAGSFISRVYDGGTNKTWEQASWTADLPDGTNIKLFQRKGNTANPDDISWTPFTEIVASGNSVGGNSRYIQYRADLSTTNNLNSPVLKSMAVVCSESVCPAVVFTPLTGSTLTTAVANANYSQTISTDAAGYNFTATGLPAGLTMELSTGIISGIPTNEGTFSNIVVTATLGACVVTASYSLTVSPQTIVPACFEDLTSIQFNQGNTGNSTIVDATGVILKPVTEEFTTLPPTTQWASYQWTGGTSTVVDGKLVVSGARYNTEPLERTFGPGTAIEFVATFGATGFQHIGFGAGNNIDMYNNTAIWAMFSTNNTNDQLQARVANGALDNYVIPGNFLGTAHRYKIVWNANGFDFHVDGILVHTFLTNLTTPMRVGISDLNISEPAILVDWIQILPANYPEAGSFISRVYDGGTNKTWGQASWTSDLPAGTSIQLSQRQGNTANPDDISWTEFKAIAASGNSVGGNSRYIQYRAELSTTNILNSPVLKSMAVACSEPVCPAVVFTPLTGSTLTTAVANANYSQTISTDAAGYNFTATGLPAGLTMELATGIISGIPTNEGTFSNVVVTATLGACIVTASYSLTVSPQTIVPACFEDLTSIQFNQGNTGNSTIVDATGVQLKPVTEEFTTLPPTTEWASYQWTGGTSTVVDGKLVVSGARYNTEPLERTFGPGTAIEFVATFGATGFQHIGFGAGNNIDMYNNTAIWAMFSTNGTNDQLQARVANGALDNYVIPGNFLGTAHRYKIVWNANGFDFHVDGILVHTFLTNLTTPMRVGISDYNISEPAIVLDWIQILPANYPGAGSFISRVYDGGTNKTWGQASWTSDLPAGTSIQLSQRQGNTANPDDNSWTEFKAIAASGNSIVGTSRYIQYRADLSTTNILNSPVLKSMAVACSEPVCPSVVFTPLTGSTLTTGIAGAEYSQTISTNPAGYTFTASGLPSALSIAETTGIISGKPAGAGVHNAIVVTATNGTCIATASYSLTIQPNPLPVTLTRFMVTKEGSTAVLNWSTTQEINSERFDIERSSDIKNWKNLGSMLAKGESTTLQTYVHIDNAPLTGQNYYRLKMIDRDGTFAYSRVQQVRFGEESGNFMTFPNPASERLEINITDMTTIKTIMLFDLKGNVVYTASGNRLSKIIDVKAYSSGMYILELVQKDGQVRTSKIVILK